MAGGGSVRIKDNERTKAEENVELDKSQDKTTQEEIQDNVRQQVKDSRKGI
jgi:hypothetical protein